MTKRYWIPAVLVLVVGWMWYPLPAEGLLLRLAPGLEGRTTGMLGASVAIGMDPSHYYHFHIAATDLHQVVDDLSLERSRLQDYYIGLMQGGRAPFFWHRWWWQPSASPGVVLYEGMQSGNHLLLLHDPDKGLVYLAIQNT